MIKKHPTHRADSISLLISLIGAEASDDLLAEPERSCLLFRQLVQAARAIFTVTSAAITDSYVDEPRYA